MIIGITGRANAGKDTIADVLVRKHDFVKIGLADPIKRACKVWFDWSDETLWGPSANRNIIDPRYGKTPREALQKLGTEFARAYYPNVWVDIAIRRANYSKVVIPDVRFLNELEAIHKAGGKVIKVVRPPTGSGADAVSDVLWSHSSETEQDAFPAHLITTTYINSGTLEDIEREIDEAMKGPILR